MLRLEDQATLFGGFEFAFAVFELLVEKDDGIGDVSAIAGNVGFAEDIDQALDDVLGQYRVFRVAEVRLANRGGDLEQIVLLAFDDDILGQAGYRALHLVVGGNFLAELGRAHHAFEIDHADQRLADLGDCLLAVAGNFELFGQDILELDVDPCPAFIAVGDEGNRKPAEDADPPGHGERKPTAVPHRMQRAAKFVEDFLHAPAAP